MKNIPDESTINYYDHQAEVYFNNTVKADVTEICDKFIRYVSPRGRIVDLGAGSGRDLLYFKNRGFRVDGIDASRKLCRLASEYSGVDVICQKIQDWHPKEKYDGIWANASLLHLAEKEIKEFLMNVGMYLNDQGVVYVSFKEGILTGKDSEGRFFTAFTRKQLRDLIGSYPGLIIMEDWVTEDSLKRTDFRWLNMILIKKR